MCVPHALILHASFIADADGGSLLLRLLAPPTSTQRSPLVPWKAPQSRTSQLVKTRESLDAEGVVEPSQRLAAYLEGPCSNLRLVRIEARVSDVGIADEASIWASRLMDRAYAGVKPYRKLRVVVNPHGGPGKAAQIFQGRVLPILEAAGCEVDATLTTHSQHGLELARDLDLSKSYDAIVCVSGDGMLHEVLNGLVQHKDPARALAIPLAPVPAGSGNAVTVNLIGVAQGFNLALASLNIIKGKPMDVDVCSVTQPVDATQSHPKMDTSASRQSNGSLVTRGNSSSTLQPEAQDSTVHRDSAPAAAAAAAAADPPTGPPAPYETHYSFLSQAIGLMADIDIGTEHMRALGDTRFIIGFVSGVLTNQLCEVDIYVKLGRAGTYNKKVMRERVKAATDAVHDGKAPDAQKDGDPITHANGNGVEPSLKHGPVTQPLTLQGGGDAANVPALVPRDSSWPRSLLPAEHGELGSQNGGGVLDPSQWYRLDAPISALYAGKIPYVSRDLLQFPFALPSDGCVDLALQLQFGGRAAKLRAISGAETGIVVYDPALAYLKCEAYRVVPRLAAGHKRLKNGGLLSIDGESKPYRPFQVEVDGRVKMRCLSLFGKWLVPDVPPPPTSAGR